MARLIIVANDGSERVVDLRPFNSLGRHPNNTIQLLDKIVSKEHCIIEERDGSFFLRDLGALNGTYVNGGRLQGEHLLQNGDEIALGSTRARFDAGAGRFAQRPMPSGIVPSQQPPPQQQVGAARPAPWGGMGAPQRGPDAPAGSVAYVQPRVPSTDLDLGDTRAVPIAPPTEKTLRGNDDDEEGEEEEEDEADEEEEDEEDDGDLVSDTEEDASRQVSTGFSDLATAEVPLPLDRPLAPGVPIFFWLEIGPGAPGAIDLQRVTVPRTVPDGAELIVALFSQPNGFSVPEQEGLLVLGAKRASVKRQPQPELTLPIALVFRRLFFRVVTPERHGKHEFRCNIYVGGVLIQSFAVRATVGPSPQLGRHLETELDYVMSGTLRDDHLARLGEHRLSILSNDSDGTHGFRFFAGVGARGTAQLDGHEIQDALSQARRSYRRVSWGSDEPFDAERHEYRYATPSDFARLETDLIELAKTGFRLWARVAGKLTPLARAALEERMRTSGGRIQLALKRTARHVLPVALFYDHKLDTQRPREQLSLCTEFARSLRDDPLETSCFRSQCPSYADPTKVCPSGFWGYRHAIGVPLSAADDEDIALQIVRDGPTRFAALAWAGPDFVLREVHLDQLRADFKDGYIEASTRRDVLRVLAEENAHLVYFYCHGGVDQEQNPHLRVGKHDDYPIAVDTFAAEAISWKVPRPLVFINGCHTTDAEPDRAIQFVDELVHEVGALGVIGTDITVFEPVAVEMATRFFRHIRGGLNVGEAIRRARLGLLGGELNPLGLIYVPYVFTTVVLRDSTS